MPDERRSPSGGWKDVYREMGVDRSIEPDEKRCPDCDRRSRKVDETVYCCPEDGYWVAGSA